ncbi:MAG: hypothetical protein AB7I57_18305 [Pirellulales bacterium]
MTLKVRLAGITGSRSAPVQPVTVFDDAGATLNRDAALAAAIAAAPPTILGARMSTADVQVADASKSAMKFEIAYNGPTYGATLRRSSGAQTKAKKVHTFIAPVGVFDSEGDATSTHASLKWRLDRQGSATEFNAGKPITVDPLTNPRIFTYETNQPFITDAYLDLVEGMVDRGAFNSATFLGRDAGSLQLVSFSANEKDYQDWELAFGLAHRAAQTSVNLGDGVVIPTVRGCDYYWPVEVESYTDSSIQPVTKKGVVGQVWPLEDFALINLPYQGQLTTRSSNVAGVITTIYPHTLTASDNVVLLWDGGVQTADITGVGTYTITFASGTGDSLPPVLTNLIAAKA